MKVRVVADFAFLLVVHFPVLLEWLVVFAFHCLFLYKYVVSIESMVAYQYLLYEAETGAPGSFVCEKRLFS